MTIPIRSDSSSSEDTQHIKGYDFVGDVHGCAPPLINLLERLGYRDDGMCYRHPEREAIFVGDLVDRGNNQLQVLEIVKRMVNNGSGRIVMGNHEFNAVAYSIEHPAGSRRFLRPHNEKNANQHRAFLEQVKGETRAM